VTEGAAAGRGGQDLRAVVGGQLRRPGQEVRVQVRVGGEGDRQPVAAGRRPQVPRRIHRQCPPVTQAGEVSRVPEPLVHDGHDQRSGHG
jgi:hypothetical protein